MIVKLLHFYLSKILNAGLLLVKECFLHYSVSTFTQVKYRNTSSSFYLYTIMSFCFEYLLQSAKGKDDKHWFHLFNTTL